MYFTAQKINKILQDLKKYTYRHVETVTSYKIAQAGFDDGKKPLDQHAGEWRDFQPSDRWGGRDAHCWFMTDIRISSEFAGRTVLYELETGREGQWDATNPQFMIYVNGRLIQGLDVNHREILLTGSANAGDIFNIRLYAYSGMNAGLVELKSRIAALDTETEKLHYHIKVPYDAAMLLEEEDKRRIDVLKYLNEAVNKLDLRKPFSAEYDCSVVCAIQYLEMEFYDNFCGKEDITALAVGHTHIDVAWLWTLAQTREKAARSFSTVLNLMKQYPEYIFMSSQPQLYKFIKEDYPEIYQEIKEKVQEGRWEPEGAMWLEADCNLSSGEALVRQLLFGIRFFEKEFGIKSKILWLPDVFGYSAALPQIMKKSGIDYFMTTKISWSEYNKMPYDTFMWRGMDGSEVLTHFITTQDSGPKQNSNFTTYNGNLIPTQVKGAWDRYQQKEINDQVLIAFGYGDGGGGPTKQMLENARRMEKGIPGCPKVKLGKSLDFFRRLEKSVSKNPHLPRWVGELYLEYHRGTYTTMARNKKYNRKSEFLYQDAELFSVLNSVTADNGRYPREKLNSGWETILLNQFHDILPGSSIKEVYEESKAQYLSVLEEGRQILDNAVTGIVSGIGLEEVSIIVTNQLGFYRTDVVEFQLPQGYKNAEVWDEDRRVPSQLIENSTVLFLAEDVPGKGYKAFSLKPAPLADLDLEVSENTVKNDVAGVENPYFRLQFNENMNITSIFDNVNNREVLKAGEQANVLQAFEDRPHNYDAWDINIYYQEKMWEINDVQSARILEDGSVRTVVEVVRKFLDSTLVQKICLYKRIPRIDFINRIDWKEKQILLKTAFPVDIHAEKATYEIQYGNVERPTHWNTSWDYARFEVCAHKWADLSEDGYGVSMMNDCKYGHDIKDGVIRLTLLKSAIDPNADADREVHEFTYSLYPHAGGWKEAGTVQLAYSLNCPMGARVEMPHAGKLPKEFSLIKVDGENVIMEVVKQAEDSEDIIVRLYECYNRRTQVQAVFFKELSGVWECDLTEKELKQVDVQGGNFQFRINPYEIKTFKLKL